MNLPPPVTPSDEEPIAAGVRQQFAETKRRRGSAGERSSMQPFLPPPVTPSDEEPIAAGGR